MKKKSAPFYLTGALEQKIKEKHQEIKEKFAARHPHAENFFKEKVFNLGRVREHSAKLLTAGTLAGAILLSSGKAEELPQPPIPAELVAHLAESGVLNIRDPRIYFVEQLKKIIPEKVCPLSTEQEKQIGFLLERLTGVRARASLEGEKLNTCFGLIGAEQHLLRFPGDTISQHDEFQESGIAPGRGAWGYFTWSKSLLRPDDILREKYYVAVQTLYLPDWEKRFSYLCDWYKYRKVLVLNPENGRAVVAVVADAGPAAWTGKQFGGSPEVMYQLDLHTGPRKGPVLLFFVDDPQNQVPLGPVDYHKDASSQPLEVGQEKI